MSHSVIIPPADLRNVGTGLEPLIRNAARPFFRHNRRIASPLYAITGLSTYDSRPSPHDTCDEISMSGEETKLSNPFSTGGGGYNFENNIQTMFVILMLSGGVAPCLPAIPIKKIKLQGRYEGYETDDCIVFLEQRVGDEKPKLLAQIRHKIRIAEKDKMFRDVICAAWRDFKNPAIFDPHCDVLALITGPLSTSDTENVRTILEWARSEATAEEFLKKVNRATFSSGAKRAKLKAFRTQLKKANDGIDLTDDELWRFLKSYHMIGYDFDVASGAALSLVKSHVGQFAGDNISEILAVVAKEVASFNQSAGTITIDTLSTEVRTAFKERVRPESIPTEFLKALPEAQTTPIPAESKNAIAFASLLGSWNENVEGDLAAIKELIKGDD